jgi:hypothetical protein
LAGALFFDEKIHQSAPLFRLGLRNEEILYLRAAIQRTIDASPTFMEYGLAKKIAKTKQAGGLDSILHEGAQDFEVFKNIQE